MTRVNINGSNHQVEVHHDGGDLGYVIEKAQKLWDETKPAPAPPGPAFGYSSQVRLPTNYSQYGRADFGAGDQPMVDR
jgi:hypothetical protein